MRTVLSRSLLALAGAAGAAFGVVGIVDPELMAEWIHVTIQDDFARTELRASYGALWVAMGALVFRGAFGALPRQGLLWMGVTWSSLPAIRLTSFALGAAAGGPVVMFAAVEVGLAAAIFGGVALRSSAPDATAAVA